MMIRKYKDLLKEVESEHENLDKLHRNSKVLIVDGMQQAWMWVENCANKCSICLALPHDSSM